VLQHLLVAQEAVATVIQVLRNQQLGQLIQAEEAVDLDGFLVLRTQEEMAALE
jgi:hypothetical protein